MRKMQHPPSENLFSLGALSRRSRQADEGIGTKNQRLVGDGRFVGETPQNIGIRQFWVYQTSSVDCTQCDGTPLRATPGNLRNIVDLHWQQPSFDTRGVGIRGVDDGR